MTPQGPPRRVDLDLGDGVTLRWTSWEPDPALNPWAADLPALGPGEHFGAILSHRTPDGGYCEGMIQFDTPRTQAFVARSTYNKALWQVQSWEPLTISPSVLCSCGWHGFIREGKWVDA